MARIKCVALATVSPTGYGLPSSFQIRYAISDAFVDERYDDLYYLNSLCSDIHIKLTEARKIPEMSRVMRKPTFYIYENKDADQLRGNREADQRLCFRYIDSTSPLLYQSEISSL